MRIIAVMGLALMVAGCADLAWSAAQFIVNPGVGAAAELSGGSKAPCIRPWDDGTYANVTCDQ